jgi:hypothetical protein
MNAIETLIFGRREYISWSIKLKDDKEASVTATNWSVKQPIQPHTDTRGKYLLGEGNCLAIVHIVRLLRGKQALDWMEAGANLCEHKVPALRPSDTSRSLSLHSSVVTLFGHRGPKVPGESFIHFSDSNVLLLVLCEPTCKRILLRLQFLIV